MSNFVLLSLTAVSTVLKPPAVSRQSSVMVEACPVIVFITCTSPAEDTIDRGPVMKNFYSSKIRESYFPN